MLDGRSRPKIHTLMWCLGDNAGHNWGLTMKCPPWDMCLSTWSLACGVVWKGCGTFRRCSLAGGSVLLEAGFENTSCSVSASWVWMLCVQPASDSCGFAFPALRGNRLYQSGTGSQNKTFLDCAVFIKVFHYNNRNTKETNRHTQISQESFTVEETETQRNMVGSGQSLTRVRLQSWSSGILEFWCRRSWMSQHKLRANSPVLYNFLPSTLMDRMIFTHFGEDRSVFSVWMKYESLLDRPPLSHHRNNCSSSPSIPWSRELNI